jgi:hypothetical protein
MAPALLLAAILGALPTQTLTLPNPDIDELSGLTVSRRDATLLWGHNDSGSRPLLYRIGLHGEDLGRVWVPDAVENDWEDIAAYTDARGPALLIADTGNNFAMDQNVTLYAVLDPGRGEDATPLWRLDFSYPDGPRDCEAMAVDEARQQVLLVSKRESPPHLSALPLPASAPRQPLTARDLGPLPGLARVTLAQRVEAPDGGRFDQSPTAMTISADGRTAVLLTPRTAYLYRRGGNRTWPETLLRGPDSVYPLPRLRQIEAGALSADGRHLYIGSEGSPAPFAHLRLPAAAATLPAASASTPAPAILR